MDQQGDVNLSVSDNGPASGANFTLFPADPPRYYEISTDAQYTGNISITLNYDDAGMTAAEEALVALWHYDGNTWVDITQVLDVINNKVTGSTTSLSPFVIGISESPTDVGDQIGFELPNNFILSQNYPNPFNPTTVVEYSVPTRTDVLIEIFNINGQKVRTLVNGTVGAGTYKISWDGNNSLGQKVSSGMYFYRFQAGDHVETKKMLLLK